MLHVDLHIQGAHEVLSRKTAFLCSLCKKTKSGAKISPFPGFLSFCKTHEKCRFFGSCAHVRT
jgi:hypothetical protein